MKRVQGTNPQVNDVVLISGVRFKVLPKMLGGGLIDIDFRGTGAPSKLVIDPETMYELKSRTEFEMREAIISGPRCRPVKLMVPETKTTSF